MIRNVTFNSILLSNSKSSAVCNLPHLILFSLHTVELASNTIQFFEKKYLVNSGITVENSEKVDNKNQPIFEGNANRTLPL